MNTLISAIDELERTSKMLEPDSNQLTSWFESTRSFSTRFLEELKNAPAYMRRNTATSKDDSSSPFQMQAAGFEGALREMMERILADGMDTAGNRYFGYIPGGGVLTGAFGDFLAALTNRYSGIFDASPGAVRIENEVIQFFLDLFHFPSSAWGSLTSGGSIANLTALLAARETRPRSEWDQSTIYMTEQCHSCCARAIRTLGLNPNLIRIIPTENQFRMNIHALKTQLEEDLRVGLRPWIVISSLGTTNTGSVDPISELVQLRKEVGFWLHVDAAYGGFFILTEQGRSLFEGISEVDSLVLDPHKSLFMPYGCGAVLVRDSHILKKALATEAAYLGDLANDHEKSPADYSLELTRNFRAPRIYLSLRTFGIAPFQACLAEKLALTQYAFQQLQCVPHLEFACEPTLTVIPFRVKGEDHSTRSLLDRILERGKIHLSSTKLNGKLYLRICVLSFRSHLEQVEECIREIKRGLV